MGWDTIAWISHSSLHRAINQGKTQHPRWPCRSLYTKTDKHVTWVKNSHQKGTETIWSYYSVLSKLSIIGVCIALLLHTWTWTRHSASHTLFLIRETSTGKPLGAGQNLQRACLWAEEWLRMICRGPFKGLKLFSGPGCELHSPRDPTLFAGSSWECSPVGVGGAQSRCKRLFPWVSRRQATLIIIVTHRLETCKTRHLGALPGVTMLQEFQFLLFWIWASGCFPASHVQSGHWIYFSSRGSGTIWFTSDW